MKSCLQTFTKWIFCLLVFSTTNELAAQNVASGFCDYAIDASCGVTISNQTTVGATNAIWKYEDCNSYTFSAPEKVYKFTTNSVGTIKVDLSIYTANLDLDILLLANDCTTPTCLAQSISSNASGQLEQIIFNDAPAGTYYLIVDGEKDTGAFDLLISCNAAQGCNLDYTATPKPIICGATRGAIEMDITFGKAPFKIEWDNANNTIWNSYTTSSTEYTISNLPEGSYTVKITDAMGCVLMRNNVAVINSSETLDATFSTTPAPCGSNFGWIDIDVANSSPNYWVTVRGPRNGSVNATSNSIVIRDMPPGNYEVTIEKGGCSKQGWVTVGSTQDLDFEAEVTNAACGGTGSVWMTVEGGASTYTVEWWHIDGTSNWVQSVTNSFSLDDLKPGEYTIKVTGRNGCTKTKKVVMGGESLDYAIEANAASCGGKGSIWVDIANGAPGYVVEWTGPTDGWKNTDDKSFAIEDLAPGQYEISIKDANGCVKEDWITIESSGGTLDFDLEANSATCNGKGAIWVTVNNGTSGYTVEWWGPGVAKWATTQLSSFQLQDLGAGEYTVKITDAIGCSNTEKITIEDSGNGLDIVLETSGISCGAKGAIWIELKNGTPDYSVDITGPNTNKWFNLTSNKAQVSELNAGTYTVQVTDKNGCTGSKTITIEDNGNSLAVDIESTAASCGEKGSFWVTIQDGTPKYNVELWGPNNVTFWAQTNSNSFKLSELNPGDYTLKITDKNGCSDTQTKTVVGNTSNLGFALEVNNANCQDDGRIWVTITGGTPGYNLRWTGPSIGEANMSATGYQINNLKVGNYTVTVKDHYGCSYAQQVSVYGTSNNLTLALEANDANCSQNGYLWADVKNGEGPYNVSWTGATDGAMTVNNAGFQVPDLPAGNYTVSIVDKNGCGVSQVTTVNSSAVGVDFSLEANNGACGEDGYAWVTINSGEGPYHISWAGPVTGEAGASSSGYQISDLPGGTFWVTVKDKHGCQSVEEITIVGSSAFSATTQITNGTCGSDGQIWIDLIGGNAPYDIKLEGPMLGQTSTSDNKYHFASVPPGAYTLTLKDISGCEIIEQIIVTSPGGNVTTDVETNNALCNQKGSAWLTLNGGEAPYTISWTGPISSSAITNTSDYQLLNLPAGSYAVLITDKHGCYINKSITINNTGNSLNLSLEANSASCGQKGAIDVTSTGGTAPFIISWTGPSSGSVQTNDADYSIADLNSGTYTVVIKDKNGCAQTQSVTVGSNVQDFSITVASTDAACGGKGAAQITMYGGSPNYNISWTGPYSGATSTSSTNYQLDNLTPGTYTITVKEYSGCEATQTITIEDSGSNLALTLQATAAGCSSKGSIYASISGGTAGFSYSWTGPVSGSTSTSQTAYTIANLPAGDYSITTRDSKGCEATQTVTVTDSGSNLGLTLQATAAGCSSKGSIYASISGGTAGFSYSWTGPVSGSTSTSQTAYRIDNLPAGDYSITTRDSKGCEATQTVTVTDSGSNLGLTLQATAAGCSSKGSIYASISGGTAGFSYSWTGPVSGSTSTSQTAYRIDNLPAGDYSITTRDSKGCEATQTVTVTDSGSNLGLTLQATAAGCSSKGSIYAAISGGTAGFSYSWTGPVSGSTSTSQTAYTIANLPAGDYTITTRDSKGCEATQTVTVTDSGSNLGLTLQATAAGCSSKGSIYAAISGGTAGFSYSWTGPVSGSTSTSQTAYTIANLPAGDYTITTRDSKGCEATQTVTVTDSGSNLGLTLQATAAGCSSKGSIYASISGGTAGFSYSWTGPVSGSTSTSQTAYRIDNLPAGDYSITTRDSKGCEATQTVTIEEEGSNIGLVVTAKNASCNGNGAIRATASGGEAGYTYSWTGPVSGSTSTIATDYNIANLPAGTYSVVVKDAKGCTATETITIKIDGGALTVDLSSTTSVACEHDGTTLVSIGGGTAPYTISYTGPSSGTVVSASDSYQVTGLLPGDYVFNITDANGCIGSRKITVYDTGSDLAIALTPTDAACGNKGMMVVTISGGISNYIISWQGGGISGSVTTGNNSFSLTDLPVGTYTVEVKDGIGCTVTETASVNNIGGNLGVHLAPNNDVCGQGGSIEVTMSGGTADYHIEWTGPISGSASTNGNVYTIDGLSVVGNYSVTVTDANGCEAKEWVAINTVGSINVSLTGTDAVCNNKGDILVNLSSGAPDFTINWSGPTSGTKVTNTNVYRIENLTEGTYTVTIKDAKGCESSETIEIDGVGTNLGLVLTNMNTTCGAANGNINATVTDGKSPYTFSWSGPVSGSQNVSENNYAIGDLPAGNYTISVTDANGCIETRVITISDGPDALGLNVVGKDAACGQPSSIQVTISNGVPDFNIEWTGPISNSVITNGNSYTISDVVNGEYTIRVTDDAGCTKAQAVIINSNVNDVNFTYESNDASCTSKGSIWLTISNGNGPYQIVWTGPSNGSTTSADGGVQITDLDSGVYTVTVNDKNGCSITQTIEVKNTGQGSTVVSFSNKAKPTTCNEEGSILLTMINGTAPYSVDWSGPTSGSRTANSTDILIDDLDIGTYIISVTSAGGCGTKTKEIEIEDKRIVLGIVGTVNNGVCGGKGNVQLSWTGDRDPYTISWSGTEIGSITTNDNTQTISDLKNGTYLFTVTGFDGCEGKFEATIDNGGTSNIANFSYANNAKTISFTNLSPAGTYAWNFGDGATSTEMNPVHTYEKNGSYTVCLDVTNSCGTQQKCKTITINAVTGQGSSAKVVLGDMNGPKGKVLQLPVRVENCSKLGTLSGTIMIGNDNAANIMGLSPNAISPIYNSDNNTFSYLASGTGMNITSETVLFYINVQLVGGVGQSSKIDLSSLPVALELTCTENGFSPPITPEVISGRVSVSNQELIADVTGVVKTYWGDGISDAMVNISSIGHEMNPMTATNGQYTADEMPMGYEYTFKPSKTSYPANGLSTFGLFLTQKYILGYVPDQIVSPYQVVAMDANCSGTLTTFDLFAMQQMLVGNITEFPGCDSWVFVSADHEFPEAFDNMNVFPFADSHTMMLESADATADFIGVKVGDVLGRAVPVDNVSNNIAEDRNRQVLPIYVAKQTVNAGEVFEVSFRTRGIEDMVSYQLGLDFNPQTLAFSEFIPTTKGDLTSTIAGIQDNQLKVSWYDPSGNGIGTGPDEEMFTIKFVAKQNISNIIEQIQLNNRTFVSELHKATNDAYRFKLELQNLNNSTYKVHQNTPNPFKDFTTITIEAPTENNAELILHDNFGRAIRNTNHKLKAGRNQLQISRKELGAGVYYYTLKSGDFVDTKRMLIIE